MLTKTPSHPFIIRNFKYETDFSPLLQLRRIIENSMLTAATLQVELDAPNQEPEQDLWIAESIDDLTLLGYSIGFHTVPERYLVWGGVLQDWRRQGIGSALLGHSITRARTLNVEHILINLESHDEAASFFLQQRGFWKKSHVWSLSMPDKTTLAPLTLPNGYSIYSFAEVKDYQILYDAYFASCYDLWGHGANSKKLASTTQPLAKDWQHWFSENDPYGEGIFFIFTPNNRVVGICRGRLTSEETTTPNASTGYIDALGVAPEYRVLGLERPLTLATMHWLRRRGYGPITLEVYGIDEEKVKLYQELGFTTDYHLIAYNLELNKQ